MKWRTPVVTQVRAGSFIKLTQSDSGVPAWINFDLVHSFEERKGMTLLVMSFDETGGAYLKVNESVEQILDILES